MCTLLTLSVSNSCVFILVLVLVRTDRGRGVPESLGSGVRSESRNKRSQIDVVEDECGFVFADLPRLGSLPTTSEKVLDTGDGVRKKGRTSDC